MTAKEIAHLIENPHLCSAENVADLKKLASTYPYAQTFPILLLQHLGRTNSLDFEETLNQNAYKIADRSHLYFLINDQKNAVDVQLSVQKVEEDVAEPVIENETVLAEKVEFIPEEIRVETVQEEIPLPEIDVSVSPEIIEIENAIDPIPEPEIKIAEEVIYTAEPTNPETIKLRPDIDINPNEDMSHFEVLEVQEMNFEPVTIDFEENGFVPVQLEEIEPAPIEIPEIEVPVPEEIEETFESIPEPETEIVLEEIPEIVEPATVENSIPETQAIETPPIAEEPIIEAVEEIFEIPTVEPIVPAEIENIEVENIEVENFIPEPLEVEIPIHQEEEIGIEEEIVTETVDLEIEETFEEIIPSEFKSFIDFDPTKDLFENPVESETTENFNTEPEEKTFVPEAIEKINDPQMDELTSHAISAGYQISELQEEEIIANRLTTPAAEVTKDFEQKIADDKRSFMDWLKTSATTHSAEYQVKQQRTEEIVDRFIKEDPKITRITKQDEPAKKTAEFFKVSKIAKESLNEKIMPISETLAQIYEDQGNYLKAIDSYKQLMLLNPEKKSFFANRIKKLKNK
jgi:hypothetical protein